MQMCEKTFGTFGRRKKTLFNRKKMNGISHTFIFRSIWPKFSLYTRRVASEAPSSPAGQAVDVIHDKSVEK